MKKRSQFKKRFFWNLILLCPKFIREKIIRARFEIMENLDPNLRFKIATTKDEIEQALNLVYEAYIDLNYIDENPEQMHLTKYLALPTTTILVIKLKEEVIGTMSIVLDSSLGLPSETTWNISQYKKMGNIAEISALAIKKEISSFKGQLLLPLIKLTYLFSRYFLKLDGFVIATTYEVEPFYTDLLLYEKIPDSRGQKHNLVKGNKSTCCFLKLDDSTAQRYHEVYAHKDKKHNLYHFFYEGSTPHIQLPRKKISIQAQLKEKNLALVELLKEKPQIFSRFSERDKLIISNLEPSNQLATLFTAKSMNDRKHPRLATMIQGRIAKRNSDISLPARIVGVSESGLQFKLLNHGVDLQVNDEISIKIQNRFFTSTFLAKVMWAKDGETLGCLILEKSERQWRKFYRTAWVEVQGIIGDASDQKENASVPTEGLDFLPSSQEETKP